MTAMKYEEIEIFKDIEFNPYTKARYKVSTFGRVISKKTGKELKPYIRSGYPTVMLHISAIKRKHFPLHRLVAITFLPNPFQFPQVNHKDQDKLNPHLNNLEWCTAKYNINYGDAIYRRIVAMLDHNPEFLCMETGLIYQSQSQAARELGLDQGNISRVLSGKHKSCGGYHFQWLFEFAGKLS